MDEIDTPHTPHTLRIRLYLLTLSIIIVIGILFVLGLVRLEEEGLQTSLLMQQNNPFEEIYIEASSAIVWDVVRGRALFSKNPNAQLPLASLSKLLTALVAKEDGGNISVAITKEAILKEGDQGLVVGEVWTISHLIDLTLLASSNDGARALASVFDAGFHPEESIRNALNRKARALNLATTFFINESGLDVNQAMSGAYGSAYDVARLLDYIIVHHPTLVEATPYSMIETRSETKKYTIKNTNDFVHTIPGVIASKTGFTDLAGGNLAIAFEAGPMHPIIVVALNSTTEARFTDVEALVWASLEYLKLF